jgi:hypothetical protein
VADGEELNKQILEAFAKQDIPIALPASTHYLSDKHAWTDLTGNPPAGQP